MKAGILGATGYAGVELARLLARHPGVDSLALSSVSFEGKSLGEVYPHLLGAPPCAGEAGFALGNLALRTPGDVLTEADVVFAALPAGVSEEWAAQCAQAGKPFIDLSADFRFGDDEETYASWYGKRWRHPELHRRSVYGLPELFRGEIRSLASRRTGGDFPAGEAVIIGNPGCYPTAASLAAAPALTVSADSEARAARGGTFVVDAASGVTGAGREPGRLYHFPEMADSMTAYKVGAHRHTPEIARNFALVSGAKAAEEPRVIFTPHLAPMNRGILATVYIPLAEVDPPPASSGSFCRPPTKDVAQRLVRCREAYEKFYESEPFVRVLPEGVYASTNRVRGSNLCEMSVHLDQRGSTLIVCAAIDNMIKGAAGQAIQNMNILMGFDEAAGLRLTPGLF